MDLNDIFKINPFRINPVELILAKINRPPEEKDNYKVTVNLKSLNSVIHGLVVEKTRNLEKLAFDSYKGNLNLRGHYIVRDYPLARAFRLNAVDFYAKLRPVSVRNNHIRFRVENFVLENHKKKKFDLVRLLSRFDPIHKRIIMKAVVEVIPEILSLTRLQNEVRFNTNYFLEKVPGLAEHIRISRVIPDQGLVYVYLRSNTMIKALMDGFGPEFLTIDVLREETDSLRLLWKR